MWNMARGTSLSLCTAPIISHRVQSSPAMASISCFLSRARPRYEAVTRLPTVTQLEDGGGRRVAPCCVCLQSRSGGQEALLKNKGCLCFGDATPHGACSESKEHISMQLLTQSFTSSHHSSLLDCTCTHVNIKNDTAESALMKFILVEIPNIFR